tara:strand:+ start:399 stop:632 length:234 start_codon:yes stop_codon:yes gene_type:complete
MDRSCNLDAKGRAVRFLTGIFAILAGLVMALLVLQGTLSIEMYGIAIAGSIVGGLFAMWEAREGWCIVRAMGIKTPL